MKYNTLKKQRKVADLDFTKEDAIEYAKKKKKITVLSVARHFNASYYEMNNFLNTHFGNAMNFKRLAKGDLTPNEKQQITIKKNEKIKEFELRKEEAIKLWKKGNRSHDRMVISKEFKSIYGISVKEAMNGKEPIFNVIEAETVKKANVGKIIADFKVEQGPVRSVPEMLKLILNQQEIIMNHFNLKKVA